MTEIHNQHLIKEWFGITLDKKYEFDLEDYSKRVYKEYWKYKEIGNKQFDYTFLLDKSEKNTNFHNIDVICLE